jgi:hypothetical protein
MQKLNDIYMQNRPQEEEQQPVGVLSGLETQKFLYESGLQNIFNDYQRSIATLSQSKQKAVQDAYYIKELSKKYLGEHASNVGVGDVSGNLIDIYSRYQSHIGEIETHHDELKLGLSEQFNQAKLETFYNLISTEFAISQEQFNQNEQDIIFQIQTGAFSPIEAFQHLEREYAAGNIRPETYRTIYSALYAQGLGEITENITSGYYGYDDVGNRITNPLDYLDHIKDQYNLTDKDFNTLRDRVQYMIDASMDQDYFSYTSPIGSDGQENPNYIQGFDPSLYTSDKNVASDSLAFNIAGQDYASSSKSSETITNEINDEFASLREDPESPYYQQAAIEGTVFWSNYYGKFYAKIGDNWHELITINRTGLESVANRVINEETGELFMSQWYDGNTNLKSLGVTINAKRITIDGIKYKPVFKANSTFNAPKDDQTDLGQLSKEQADIWELFLEHHSVDGMVRQKSFVYYKGNLYFYNTKKIRLMQRA